VLLFVEHLPRKSDYSELRIVGGHARKCVVKALKIGFAVFLLAALCGMGALMLSDKSTRPDPTAWTPASAPAAVSKGEDESPAMNLAILAGERDDTLKINRYKSLLSQLSNTYTDNEEHIAGTAYAVQGFLKDKGISETTLNVLEGLNSIFPGRVPNQKIDEWAKSYMILRDKGQSHEQAVAGLAALAGALSN
jgi:hypothetical protein